MRQRRSIPFREIARTAFKVYPKRAVLGFSLFIGQAFLYNAVTVTLGLTLTTYLGVGANKVGLFYAVFAAGNFIGPLLLGRLFDTVGRRPMIAGTYLISAVMLAAIGIAFNGEVFSDWGLTLALAATFFFASAGASSAYLTVSEIFPMEIRALAIAFFYAIGTAIGGITGPLVFEKLGESGRRGPGDDRLPDRRRRDGRRRDRRAHPRASAPSSSRSRTSPSRSPPARRRRAPAKEEPDAEPHARPRSATGATASAGSASGWACAASGPGPAPAPTRRSCRRPSRIRQWLDHEISIIDRALQEHGDARPPPARRAGRRPLLGAGSLPCGAARRRERRDRAARRARALRLHAGDGGRRAPRGS